MTGLDIAVATCILEHFRFTCFSQVGIGYFSRLEKEQLIFPRDCKARGKAHLFGRGKYPMYFLASYDGIEKKQNGHGGDQ